MKSFLKKKKWIRRLSILLLIAGTLIFGVYYTILFRFKEAVQFIVDRESDGVYSFDASSIKVSLLKKTIRITNALLTCKDTLGQATHYDISIPKAFLAVESWHTILVEGKIVVDSLVVDSPGFRVHEHTAHRRSNISMQVSNMLQVLQKVKAYLRIGSFTLNNAAFTYGNRYEPASFGSGHINFSVKNFSDTGNEDRFFSSDDVDLKISRQHWTLPDGKHTIDFSNLHFSGSKRFFEVDSFAFSGRDSLDNFFAVKADKLFFNSEDLTSVYTNEQLLLDSVILFRPVVTIPLSRKGNAQATDTTQLITQSLQKMFRSVNLKYVDVREGHVAFSRADTVRQPYISDGTDLRIYNLTVKSDTSRITTDSVVLSQKGIMYVTNDSLFRLTIGEFYLRNDDVLLKNAVYGPTERNRNPRSVTFKAPLLRLHNIGMEDLIAKRLRAEEAELVDPEIIFTNASKMPGKTASKEKQLSSPLDSDNKFYTTLHGIRELISVEKFRIQKGRLSYTTSGKDPVKARMDSVDMVILLNRFFSSDSLVDIKRSLQQVNIGNIVLSTPRMSLSIADFNFKGEYRHNIAGSFRLTFNNGTAITGNNMSWIIFDWDRFQRDRSILVNTMHVGTLSVATGEGNNHKADAAAKELPPIHIDRLDIDTLLLKQGSRIKGVSLHGAAICLDELSFDKRKLLWGNIQGKLYDITVHRPHINAMIKSFRIDNQSASAAEQVEIESVYGNSRLQVTIPHLTIDLPLHTSHFSTMHFNSVSLEHPELKLVKRQNDDQRQNGDPVSSKDGMAVTIDKLYLNNGDFRYTDSTGIRPVMIDAKFTLTAGNMVYNGGNDTVAVFDRMEAGIKRLHYHKRTIAGEVPQMDLVATGGKILRGREGLGLKAAVNMHWQDADIAAQNADSNGIFIKQLSGNFNDNAFALLPGAKMHWQDILKYANIRSGHAGYKSAYINAAANSVVWDRFHRSLSVGAFKIEPTLDADSYFSKKGYQADYITLKGKSLQVSGVQWDNSEKDAPVSAVKMVVWNPALTTLKDKRLPAGKGREKMMFTRLIKKIKYPFAVDSVLVMDAAVTVNEIVEKTNLRAVVPLKNVNALITGIGNRYSGQDSLTLNADFLLYDIKLHHLAYREAYADSLSSFSMQFNASPIVLPRLSALTIPFANIRIAGGYADTLYARWYGNAYAAAGDMHLYYNKLRINVLGKEDTSKAGFFRRIGNAIANGVALHQKNDKAAYIFFVRDKQRSVFNFWVKSLLNGAMSSATLFQSKKHYRNYLKDREKYSLPDVESDVR